MDETEMQVLYVSGRWLWKTFFGSWGSEADSRQKKVMVVGKWDSVPVGGRQGKSSWVIQATIGHTSVNFPDTF